MRRILVALLFVAAGGCLSAGMGPIPSIASSPIAWIPATSLLRALPGSAGGLLQARVPEYVAIRHLKMCGCAAGFVHGLALPRFTVTGGEDPRRPDGIWRFAWDVAREHIPQEDKIALAVNLPELRTEDQLHLHLVWLLPDARPRVDALRPIKVERLEEVWPFPPSTRPRGNSLPPG